MNKKKLSDTLNSRRTYYKHYEDRKDPNSESDDYDMNGYESDPIVDDKLYKSFHFDSVKSNFQDIYYEVNTKDKRNNFSGNGKKKNCFNSSTTQSSDDSMKNFHGKYRDEIKSSSSSSYEDLNYLNHHQHCPICFMNLSKLGNENKNMHVTTCLEKSKIPIDSAYNNLNDSPPDSPPEILHDDPFAVTCSSPICRKRYEARHYPAHYHSEHKYCKDIFQCPICDLQSDSQGTNKYKLIEHFKKNHSELSLIYVPDKEIIIDELDTSIYTIQYANEEDVLRECHICYEEFDIGDCLSRLTCFCLYHKDCIDEWFHKSKECPIHQKNNS
jgi:hypothetical protein